MTGQLRRLAPALLRIGLAVRQAHRESHVRPHVLEWVGKRPSQPSQPSRTAKSGHFSNDGHDGRNDDQDTPSSSPNSLTNNGNDGHDGHDRDFPHYSGTDSEGLSIPECIDRLKQGDGDPFVSLRNPALKLQGKEE